LILDLVITTVLHKTDSLFCIFHSHQQQLLITGNKTFQLPCSSPHQWYTASYN